MPGPHSTALALQRHQRDRRLAARAAARATEIAHIETRITFAVCRGGECSTDKRCHRHGRARTLALRMYRRLAARRAS
jgi:hypothetical protein